jgi:hypothetical protein
VRRVIPAERIYFYKLISSSPDYSEDILFLQSPRETDRFLDILFLKAHRETDRFFAASGVQHAEVTGGHFHHRRVAFFSQVKPK